MLIVVLGVGVENSDVMFVIDQKREKGGDGFERQRGGDGFEGQGGGDGFEGQG
jgi:hypothetical protein